MHLKNLTVSQSCAVEKFWRATAHRQKSPLELPEIFCFNIKINTYRMLKSENVGAALAKEQLCEYENQTVEAFAAAYLLYAKFDSVFNFDSVARQIFFFNSSYCA